MLLMPSPIGRNYAPYSIIEGALATDALVLDWQANVSRNGGTYSQTEVNAINKAVVAMRAAGIIGAGKITRWNPFCGTGIAAMLTCVISIVGTATYDTNGGYVEGDYSPSGGLTGGTGKSIDTGFIPTGPTGGLGVVVKAAASSASTRIPIGCRDTAGTQIYRLNQSTTPDTTGIYGGSTATSAYAGAMDAGVWHVTRTSPTSCTEYRNGVSVGTRVVSTTPASNLFSIFVGAQNNNGTASNAFSTGGKLTGYFLDGGLSDTEAAALNSILAQLQIDLGR